MGEHDQKLQKLRKLVPLLGSDKEGEVVAAAQAIVRTLNGLGLDLHDVAEAVQDRYQPPDIELAKTWSDWAEIARWCRDHHRGLLAERERGFVDNMTRPPAGYRAPSEGQQKWLRDIFERLTREPT